MIYFNYNKKGGVSMFNLFKKNVSCEDCKEHSDLEKLRELSETVKNLKKKQWEIERKIEDHTFSSYDYTLNRSCWVEEDLENYEYKRKVADKISAMVHELLSRNLIEDGIKYKDFDDRFSIDSKTRIRIRLLTSYLNKYLEYTDENQKWEQDLIAIKHEIYENNNKIGEIKRRLGVENI
jgi:hypothetical protein